MTEKENSTQPETKIEQKNDYHLPLFYLGKNPEGPQEPYSPYKNKLKNYTHPIEGRHYGSGWKK